MRSLQIMLQQLGGPDRGMITRLARIAGQGRLDQGVDDLGDRRGAARPRGVEQACPEVEVIAPEEAIGPVVNGLTADLERLGDLFSREPLGEPEHRLGTTPLLGRGRLEDEVFQFAAQARIQDDGNHRATPLARRVSMVDSTLSKDFLSGPDP